MPRETQGLSVREKAAIIYQQYSGCTWMEAYTVASTRPLKEIQASNNLNRLASAWKNSDKVQTFIREQKAIQGAKDEQRVRKAIEEYAKSEGESVHENGGGRGRNNAIDYSDPKNRQKLYNEVIAKSVDDPKTQLDAAKMFEQIQRDDRQAAREKQVQRFYTPKKCMECVVKQAFHEFCEKNTTK